ncbi:MAG: LysM peptidoglycan-binding domain-containing protein [Chloroflexi bacterium]|nr:LysM peptidoglycan-binding domain-containing protein [Chloroflexota bacterium]MYF80360.1 LysM peptidoglycan-binding domain-containing protein [Chloroflexota bacterium]MYI05527.1 LysM peptidoglycan-binding domain-containing protein [Chloroflexota bacterium]
MRRFDWSRGPLRLAALCAALLITAGLVGVNGWSRASADTYTIQAGDTLWGIANDLQIGVSVLLALNGDITSPDSIFVGQQIQIPDNTATNGLPPGVSSNQGSSDLNHQSSSALATPPQVGTYTIQSGDTLSAIALSHSTTVEAILALNPSLRPHLLWVGTEIALPRGTSTPGGGSTGSRTSLNAGVVSTEPPSTTWQTTEYIVKSGDSLSGIAVRASLTLEQLYEYNPHARNSMIHPGDVILIPIPDYLAPALDPSDANLALTQIYTVRSGDNASQIAERFGITFAELTQLNAGMSLSTIYIGQTLTVPWTHDLLSSAPGTVPAVEQRRRSHEVQAGDTFSAIADQHGLSMAELRELNPMRSTNLLIIGQLIYLPGHIDLPVVSEERTLAEADLVQYAAANLGVTPHTLLANHGWLDPGQWIEAGSSWRLPRREGLLVTVQRGDTLQAIAQRHGVDMQAILADPAHGVEDPNEIVIGQEIILPLDTPSFVWPAIGQITDPFGLCRSWDCSYRHKGLDIALDTYEPILAAADGLVTFVGGDAHIGLGWYIEIDHGNGWSSVYAHLVEFAVWQGQEVSAGEIIGYNGNTGHSTGPHLHLEIRHNDWYVDPLVMLP